LRSFAGKRPPILAIIAKIRPPLVAVDYLATYEPLVIISLGVSRVSDNRPIAVLDTGAGGLSVVAALRHIAPLEEIAYFADYAHLPYGLKSPELIRLLALNAAQTLVNISHCKALIIACHTISVWCLDEIQAKFPIPVLGMLEPSIKGLHAYIQKNQLNSLGIISTKATLESGAYRRSWPAINSEQRTQLVEQACGPLVSLIEEGSVSPAQLQVIVTQLLSEPIKQADAVMIGCTHFSALIPILGRVLKPNCAIIDAAHFVSDQIYHDLKESHQLANRKHKVPIKAYVSDNPERFLNVAQSFIAEELEIKLVRDEGLLR
jgi:glutamate racemase